MSFCVSMRSVGPSVGCLWGKLLFSEFFNEVEDLKGQRGTQRTLLLPNAFFLLLVAPLWAH